MDSIGDNLMSFVMTLSCGNDVDDGKNYATRVKMLKFLDQIVDWDADEEDKEANGGIEGGDLLYQIPVCIECPL